MKVYVVEEGDYEARSIVLIVSSPDAMLPALEAEYPAPYIVRWERIDEDCVAGHFLQVPGYSADHTSYFECTEYEVKP